MFKKGCEILFYTSDSFEPFLACIYQNLERIVLKIIQDENEFTLEDRQFRNQCMKTTEHVSHFRSPFSLSIYAVYDQNDNIFHLSLHHL